MIFQQIIRTSNRALVYQSSRHQQLYFRRFYKKQKIGDPTILKESSDAKVSVEDSDFAPYLHHFKQFANSVQFETKYTDIDELHPSTSENRVTDEDWIKDKQLKEQRVTASPKPEKPFKSKDKKDETYTASIKTKKSRFVDKVEQSPELQHKKYTRSKSTVKHENIEIEEVQEVQSLGGFSFHFKKIEVQDEKPIKSKVSRKYSKNDKEIEPKPVRKHHPRRNKELQKL